MKLSSWQQSVVNVTRAMPANGFGRRAALWIRKPVMLSLNGDEVETEVLGLKLRLQPGDNLSEKKVLFMPQFFDPEERVVMAQVAAQKPNFNFFDLGANAGLYSLIAARLTDDRAQVLAVEPQTEMVRRLRANIALNNFHNIQIIEAAASDVPGPVELVMNAANRGEASLRAGEGVRVTVQGRTMVQLMDEAGMVTQPDILKIDIEGMEDRILGQHFRDAPESRWPRIMFLERSAGRWKEDCIAMCLARGYKQIGGSKMNVILSL